MALVYLATYVVDGTRMRRLQLTTGAFGQQTNSVHPLMIRPS